MTCILDYHATWDSDQAIQPAKEAMIAEGMATGGQTTPIIPTDVITAKRPPAGVKAP
jgi:hypothetical protein